MTEDELVPEESNLPEAEEHTGARDHEAEASLPTLAGETNAPTMKAMAPTMARMRNVSLSEPGIGLLVASRTSSRVRTRGA